MNTQSLQRQIREAQKELEALRTDDAELTRLHGEKTAELEALRASKSRDFASMAALEGQRAALQTMLEEQRGEIEQAQSRLQGLEAQCTREAHLERIGQIAEEIGRTRTELFAGLSALVGTLTPELERLNLIHTRWAGLRMEWAAKAGAVGASPIPGWRSIDRLPAIEALQEELRTRGVPVDLLSLNLGNFTALEADKPDALPFGSSFDMYGDFSHRIEYIVAGMWWQAVRAYLESHHPTSVDMRAERQGEEPTPPLSIGGGHG